MVNTMEREIVPKQAVNKMPSTDSTQGSLVKQACLSKLKIFLGALAFSFFAKGFSGSYVKSILTQIERRFEISSFILGLVDGSFELGNLFVLILVSYLGSKVHRPKVIAVGCLIMSIGSFISALTHFIMGRYKFESIASTLANSSASLSPCSSASPLHPALDSMKTTGNETALGCEKTASSYLWLIVLAGNLLRGIGEAPLMPLGLSYIDDFATEQNSAFYIGIVRAIGMLGPMLGFLLGAFCVNLWVDFVSIDTGKLAISSKDTRWVGAWWLGLLISGAVSSVASLPFWFLPRSLAKEGEGNSIKNSSDICINTEDNCSKLESPTSSQLKLVQAAKEFFPTVKKLLRNSIFLLYLSIIIVQFNFFVGWGTYEPKYMEQQFSVSVSRAIFLIGVIIIPVTILGISLGGFLIKKFKIGVFGMAKFASTCFAACALISLLFFIFNCETPKVAGLTVGYSGVKESSFSRAIEISDCNSDCSCESTHWDPVCGSNGITYMSACLAGCRTSMGMGKDMIFHNCSCVGVSGPGNLSAVLGQCPRDNCTKRFPIYLALVFISAIFTSLGASPLYMTMLRSVPPELKSFAIGIETLCGRIFGGLPVPIYFGAIIDKTCLKWGTKSCGEPGSCRVYDVQALRNSYLGLITALKIASSILLIILCVLAGKRFRRDNECSKVAKNPEVFTVKLPTSSPKENEPSCPGEALTEETYL